MRNGGIMFAVGDKVVHHEYGICRIINIVPRRFPGQEPREYYEMTPLSEDGYGTKFYIPVDHGGKLRAPLTRDQIFSMIDAMPETELLKIETSGNRTLDMENIKTAYNSLMNSGDPRDWVILLRTIYRKGKQLSARKKRLSEFEVYTRDNSERLLYGEIACVMDIPVSRVEQFITQRIENK